MSVDDYREAAREQLISALWKADDWWKENRDQLNNDADWAECLILHDAMQAALKNYVDAEIAASMKGEPQ